MPPRKTKAAPAAAAATAVADQEPEVLGAADVDVPVTPPPAAAPARDAAGAPAKTRKDGSYADLDGVVERLMRTDARELTIRQIIRDCWHQDGEVSEDQVHAAMRLLAKDKRFSLSVREQVYHARLAQVTTKAPPAPRSAAFQAGEKAHAAGADMFDNPYAQPGAAGNVELGSEWEDGWLAAENAKPAIGDAPVAPEAIPPGPVAKPPGAVADKDPDKDAQLDKVVTGAPAAPATKPVPYDGFDDMPEDDEGEDDAEEEQDEEEPEDDEGGDPATAVDPHAETRPITRAVGKDAAAGEGGVAEVGHAAGVNLNHAALGRVKVLRYEGTGADRRIVVVTEQGQEKELLVAFCAGKLTPALDNGRTIGEMVAEVKAPPPAPNPNALPPHRIGRWLLVKCAVGDGHEPGWVADHRLVNGKRVYDVVLKAGKVNAVDEARLAEMTPAVEATHDRLEEVDRLRALVDAQNRHAEEQRGLTKQYRKLQEDLAGLGEKVKAKRTELQAMVERMALHGGGDVQMDWRDGLPAEEEAEDAPLFLGAPGTPAAVEPKARPAEAPKHWAKDETMAVDVHGTLVRPGAPEKPKPAPKAPPAPAATAAKGKGSLRDQARAQQALREAMVPADMGIEASGFPAAELVVANDAGAVAMPVFQGGELYALIREGLPDGYAELRRLWTPAAWARDAELEYGVAKGSADLVERDLKLERGGRRCGLVVKAKGRTWVVGPMVDSFYVKLA
jgi:hypothetical protein